MKLNPKCRVRLLDELEKVVKKIRVQGNHYLDISSTLSLFELDDILPSSGELISKYRSWVHENNPFSFFIFCELTDITFQSLSSKSFNNSQLFVKALQINDTRKFCEKLVYKFEYLPHTYKIFVELPFELYKPISLLNKNPFKFSTNFSFVLLTEELLANYGIKKEAIKNNSKESRYNNPLSEIIRENLETSSEVEFSSAYLELNITGFVHDYLLYGATESRINDLLKYFFGLSVITGILEPTRSQNKTLNPHLSIFRFHNENCIEPLKKSIDEDIQGVSRTLKYYPIFDDSKKEKLNKDFFDYNVKLVGNILDDYKNFEKILLSSRWYFDSLGTKNELLAFIQLMVSMEILLGDDRKISDSIGIGNLLSNRCAYLLGQSNSERKQLIKDFKEIYDIRSKIVHRGKPKLLPTEREKYNKLRNITKKVISKEIFLLINEKEAITKD